MWTNVLVFSVIALILLALEAAVDSEFKNLAKRADSDSCKEKLERKSIFFRTIFILAATIVNAVMFYGLNGWEHAATEAQIVASSLTMAFLITISEIFVVQLLIWLRIGR